MGRILQIVLAVVLAGVVGVLYRPFLVDLAEFALGHLLFPVLLGFLFSILFGLFGTDYGLPELFWHDRLWTRLGAAMAVTLLLTLSGVLAFYSAGPNSQTVKRLIAHAGPILYGSGVAGDLGLLPQYLIVTSPPFLAMLVAPALFPAAFPGVPRSAPAMLISSDKVGPTIGRTMSIATNPVAYALNLVTWLAGIALGIIVIALLMGTARAIGRWPLFQEASDPVIRHPGMLVFFFILAAFYAVLSFQPVYDRMVSAALAICALLGLLATAYAFIAYIYPWPFAGATTLVVLVGRSGSH